MVTRQTSPRSLHSIAGAILLAVGFLILFANLDAVAAQIANAAGASGEQTLGMLPALAQATSRALQAYAFDHAGFVSGLRQILVSFWPLILIILGAVLLRDALRGRLAAIRASAGSSAMGDRS
jgi:hypothetical protein